ncbi:MAG: hypothetical protein ACKVOQ_13560 [Cyclobacteriaceae bacterium]
MYMLTDKSQFQAQAIKQGKHKLAIVHQEITDWITKQFGVQALDFCCETRATSKGVPQQLIHLIVETDEDAKQMQANRAGNTLITERFLEYLKSANSHKAIDPLKSAVFPPESNPFPEMIVTYRPLKGLNGEMMRKMLDDEQRAPALVRVLTNQHFLTTLFQNS